ncbi:MAG: sporulation protein YabP [Bacillota bacterium]|nr:sporulation protein YabP [Bacillota bacterium]
MAEEKKTQKTAHNIILENRHLVSISGVEDVDSFDDESVSLYTVAGELVVSGTDLHINRLNVESGDVQIEGEIDSLEYTAQESKKGGFFSRLIK